MLSLLNFPNRFERTEDLTVHGLAAQRFSLQPMTTFGNTTTNPENGCYHADELPAGLHNSTACKGGGNMPVFVSLPHFQGADPAYQEQFAPGSLVPDAARHSAHMVLQAETSIPLEVAMRLQIILQVCTVPLKVEFSSADGSKINFIFSYDPIATWGRVLPNCPVCSCPYSGSALRPTPQRTWSTRSGTWYTCPHSPGTPQLASPHAHHSQVHHNMLVHIPTIASYTTTCSYTCPP